MEVLLVRKTVGDAGGFLNQAADRSGVSQTDVPTFVGIGMSVIFSILSVTFLVLAVYGGILWITSRGNEEQVKKARGTIVSAVIGLVVTVAAWAITNLVVSNFV